MPTIDNRTGVLVMQHPREHRHKLGTEPLARLGLARFHLEVVAKDARLPDRLLHEFEVPSDTALLFPSDSARDLADLPAAERPGHLLLLDGTWSQARRLYGDNPWLQRLPHVRFDPEAPSRYRIRREPDARYLSTVESIVTALRILEPQTTGLEELLRAFDRMVDLQVARAGERPRWQRKRRREARVFPPELSATRLVVVAEEYGALDPDTDDPVLAKHGLLQWTAAETDTSATFHAIIRSPRGAPSPLRLEHAGLTATALEDGKPIEQVRSEFQDFAGDAALAAWNPRSLHLAASELGWNGPTVLLKAVYSNHRGGCRGTLEDVLSEEGLVTESLGLPGRAGHRAAAARTMAQWLRREHTKAMPTSPAP